MRMKPGTTADEAREIASVLQAKVKSFCHLEPAHSTGLCAPAHTHAEAGLAQAEGFTALRVTHPMDSP
jgi:hypothetical protein